MTSREEAPIARTPKAEDATPKPRRTTAKAGAKAPASRAKAAKPGIAKLTRAKPAAKAAAKPAGTPATRAKAAPETAAKPTAKAPAAPRPARPRRAARPHVTPALLDRLTAAATKSLEDDKAENVVVLDVTGRADYADRLVIATGLADRQIGAMATHLEDALAKEGLKLRRDAIQASPDWVLIDCGDLVVHLFKPEARALYALERMWGPDSPGAPDPAPLPDDGRGGSTASEADEE